MFDVARRALAFGALALLSSVPIGHAAEQATLSGSAVYRERMLLPAGAVFEASLIDASRADAPAEVIAITRVLGARGSPIKFKLRYDPGRIQPERMYSVRGRISVGGALLFVTDTAQPVLTRGNPDTVQLLLKRARSQPEATALANTRWRLVGLGETGDERLPEKNRPWLRFTDQEGRVSGFSGCNNVMGSYRVEGDGLQLGQLISTQMFCQDTAALERAFLDALKAVTGYRIDGDRLILIANGAALATFVATSDR
jgi:putative lipoprotein